MNELTFFDPTTVFALKLLLRLVIGVAICWVTFKVTYTLMLKLGYKIFGTEAVNTAAFVVLISTAVLTVKSWLDEREAKSKN